MSQRPRSSGRALWPTLVGLLVAGVAVALLARQLGWGAQGDSPGGAGQGTTSSGGGAPRSNGSDPRVGEAYELVKQADWPAVEALLTPFIEEWPDTPRARFFLGMAIHKQKNYAQALPHLLAARGEPAFERQETVDYFLGWCLYNLGRLEEAGEAMGRFVEVQPNEGDGHFVLGLVAYDLNQLEEAEAAFQRASDLFEEQFRTVPEQRKATFAGEMAKAQGRLGDVYFDQDRLQEALQSYSIAVRYIPNHYVVWYKLSQIFEELGQTQEAEMARQRYEEFRPKQPEEGAGE